LLLEAESADHVARFIRVALHQLCPDLFQSNLVEFVEDAEDVDATRARYLREVEKQIQHGAAGETDEVAADAQCRKAVAHSCDDLGVGDLGLDADRVEI